MQLEVGIDEADMGKVKPGNAATFTVEAYPGHSFPAKIAQVRYSPETVEGVVTYTAVLSVDNADLLLRPGMTATADITVETVDDALLVPNAALRWAPPAEAAREPSNRGAGLLGLLMPRRPAREQPQASARQQRPRQGLGAARRRAGRRAGQGRLVRRHPHRGHAASSAVNDKVIVGVADAVVRAAPVDAPLIDFRNVAKVYGSGDAEVMALKGVDFAIAARRVRRHHGPERLGQVDGDEHPRLPRPADVGHLRLRRRQRRRPRRRPPGAASAAISSASSSRASTCCRAPRRSRTSSCR